MKDEPDLFASAWGELVINVLEAINPVLSKQTSPERQAEINVSMSRLLFEGISTPVSAIEEPPAEAFALKVFSAVSNTHDTIQFLRLSTRFLRCYPSKRLAIEHSEYLQYHAETFFMRLYNLRERLKKLYSWLYKDTSLFIAEVDKAFRADVDSAFRPFTDGIRNPLVHEFHNFDSDVLKQIRTLGLLTIPEGVWAAQTGGPNMYRSLYDRNKRRARHITRQAMLNVFDHVFKFTNEFAPPFQRIIFESPNTLRTPREFL